MFSLDGNAKYWLYSKPVDMRKSFNGLSGLVTNGMGAKVKNKEGKTELQILVSYCNAEEALNMYKTRWQLETMYKGLKSSGFDIEGTHVRIRESMADLFAIVLIAYVWCYLVGNYIHQHIKPIKVLKHGRKANSLFKYGLDYVYQCLINHTNPHELYIFKFLSYT